MLATQFAARIEQRSRRVPLRARSRHHPRAVGRTHRHRARAPQPDDLEAFCSAWNTSGRRGQRTPAGDDRAPGTCDERSDERLPASRRRSGHADATTRPAGRDEEGGIGRRLRPDASRRHRRSSGCGSSTSSALDRRSTTFPPATGCRARWTSRCCSVSDEIVRRHESLRTGSPATTSRAPRCSARARAGDAPGPAPLRGRT